MKKYRIFYMDATARSGAGYHPIDLIPIVSRYEIDLPGPLDNVQRSYRETGFRPHPRLWVSPTAILAIEECE